jgi:protein-L-isoaspartate(D-aspartate) O-methyltransferase
MNTRLSGIGMTSARTRDRLISRLSETGIRNPKVLDAIRNVPRHLFVDEALAHRAYEDTALPIGHGQTISQPWSVARMTEALLEMAPRRVLEIGTGSGYQTAVLCELVPEVFSIERIEALHKSARRVLQEIGYRNFRLQCADGSLGWSAYAPYDAVLIAASAPAVPPALLEQLATPGLLIMPVGDAGQQSLLVIRRSAEGDQRETLAAANFVPLIAEPQR